MLVGEAIIPNYAQHTFHFMTDAEPVVVGFAVHLETGQGAANGEDPIRLRHYLHAGIV